MRRAIAALGFMVATCAPAHAVTGSLFLETHRLQKVGAWAYVGAVWDYNPILIEVNEKTDFKFMVFCPPPKVTLEQATAVAVSYLNSNPAEWHEQANISILRALSIAWPCAK